MKGLFKPVVSALFIIFFVGSVGKPSWGQTASCPIVSATDPDADNDGVPNSIDVDEDNDGIADNIERACSAVNFPSSGVFTNRQLGTTGFTSMSSTIFDPAFKTDASPVGLSNGELSMIVTTSTASVPHYSSHRFSFTQSVEVSIGIPSRGNYFFTTDEDDIFIAEAGGFVEVYDPLNQLLVQTDGAGTFMGGTYYRSSINGRLSIRINTANLQAGKSAYQFNDGTNTISANAASNGAFYIKYYGSQFRWTLVNRSTKDNNGATFRFNVCAPEDTDGDGVPNQLDLDSDNDGIPDAIEASGNRNLSLVNSRLSYDAGSDVTNPTSGCKTGSPAQQFTPVNSDASTSMPDTTPDYLDLNSDGDGCPDSQEARISSGANTTGFTQDNATDDGLTSAGGVVPPDDLWKTFSSDCASALPVNFGAIDASVKDGILLIRWQTLSENNNSRFEMQLSVDGEHFSKVGTVFSKASDGYSNLTLDYEFNMELSDFSPLLGWGGLMALFFTGVMGACRKRRLIVALIFGVTLFSFSCQKNDAPIKLGEQKHVFVRVAQIDKNGDIKYSNTYKVDME
ncbi:hypothetical protein ABDK00_010830 [Niabella insulamsoli]|uniref:hypothetical protein n=1 Tax=Niabella insulamsoli TaxID=3144874 RepID=UPI0031FD71B9